MLLKLWHIHSPYFSDRRFYMSQVVYVILFGVFVAFIYFIVAMLLFVSVIARKQGMM